MGGSSRAHEALCPLAQVSAGPAVQMSAVQMSAGQMSARTAALPGQRLCPDSVSAQIACLPG